MQTSEIHYIRNSTLTGLVLSEAECSSFRFARHYHLDHHIGLVTDGIFRQRLQGNTVDLVPGSIQLMPAGEVHEGAGCEGTPYSMKTFRISSELLSAVTEQITGNHGVDELRSALIEQTPLFARMCRLHRLLQATPSDESLLSESSWLSVIGDVFTQARMLSPEAVQGQLTPGQLRRVVDYCHAHLAEKIGLAELASLCGLERFQFLRLFKHTFGMTPHAWFIRLRLERACELLGRTNWTLAQIAQEVGFYDQSHFTRAFKQSYGVAPSHY